jgi:hypothetical protein
MPWREFTAWLMSRWHLYQRLTLARVQQRSNVRGGHKGIGTTVRQQLGIRGHVGIGLMKSHLVLCADGRKRIRKTLTRIRIVKTGTNKRPPLPGGLCQSVSLGGRSRFENVKTPVRDLTVAARKLDDPQRSSRRFTAITSSHMRW